LSIWVEKKKGMPGELYERAEKKKRKVLQKGERKALRGDRPTRNRVLAGAPKARGWKRGKTLKTRLKSSRRNRLNC